MKTGGFWGQLVRASRLAIKDAERTNSIAAIPDVIDDTPENVIE